MASGTDVLRIVLLRGVRLTMAREWHGVSKSFETKQLLLRAILGLYRVCSDWAVIVSGLRVCQSCRLSEGEALTTDHRLDNDERFGSR